MPGGGERERYGVERGRRRGGISSRRTYDRPVSPRGRRRRPTPAANAWRSAVFPGWGQLRAGRARLGRALLVVTGLLALALAGVVVWLAVEPISVAAWLLRREVLLALVVLNGLVLGYRVLATVDAWRPGSRRLRPRLAMALAVLFVVSPHLWAGWIQFRTFDVIEAVFVDEASATTTTTTTATTVPTGTTTSAPAPDPTWTPPPTFLEPRVTPTLPDAPFGGKDRLTVLLLGSDAGPDRTGTRTDTMMVVTVDLHTGDVALFGLPRNLAGLTWPDGTPYPGILNTVYQFGLRHPERFAGPDPGATAVRTMAEYLTGLPIDYHVLVDLQAFIGVVDALGGVTVPVTTRVVDPLYTNADGVERPVLIEPGVRELEGWEALAYVRVRRGSSDYDRMARQRCLVAAMLDQLRPLPLIRGLSGLLGVLEQNVRTDVPFTLAPDLLTILDKVDGDRIVAVGFGPPDWTAGYADGGYPIPDVAAIREAVALAVEDPDASVSDLGLADAGTACDLSALEDAEG